MVVGGEKWTTLAQIGRWWVQGRLVVAMGHTSECGMAVSSVGGPQSACSVLAEGIAAATSELIDIKPTPQAAGIGCLSSGGLCRVARAHPRRRRRHRPAAVALPVCRREVVVFDRFVSKRNADQCHRRAPGQCRGPVDGRDKGDGLVPRRSLDRGRGEPSAHRRQRARKGRARANDCLAVGVSVASRI